jgi:putative transposase
MIKALIPSLKRFVNRVKHHLNLWSKPAIVSIIVGIISDLRRTRNDLIVENAMLRQQLIVLHRQVMRPQLSQGDRLRLGLLARLTGHWQQALHIAQSDTLLSLHRTLFRGYRRCKSKSEKREPRITPETIVLITQMVSENRLWGVELSMTIRFTSRQLEMPMTDGIQKYAFFQ